MRVTKRKSLQALALVMSVVMLVGILLGNASAMTSGEADPADPRAVRAEESAEPMSNPGDWVTNEADGTQVRKSLEPAGDDTYWLQFEVKGQEKIEADEKPVDVVLLLDYSGSMQANEAEMEKAAKHFIRRVLAVRNDNRIAVVAFSQNVMTGQRYPQFSKWVNQSSASGLLGALDENRGIANGGTNPKAAFTESAKLLRESKMGAGKNSQRVVVTFTDGIPNLTGSNDRYIESVNVNAYLNNTFEGEFPQAQVPRYCVYWAPGGTITNVTNSNVSSIGGGRYRENVFGLECTRYNREYSCDADEMAAKLAAVYGPTDHRLSVANTTVPDEMLDNILSGYADQILKFAEDATITDTLTEGFDFVLPDQQNPDSIQWRPLLNGVSNEYNPWCGISSKNPAGVKQDRYYEIDQATHTIRFHFDAIGKPGDCVRFLIRTNEAIDSMEAHQHEDDGKSYVYTNKTADVTYDSPKNEDHYDITDIPPCEVQVVRPRDYLGQSKTARTSTVVTGKDGYFFDIELNAWTTNWFLGQNKQVVIRDYLNENFRLVNGEGVQLGDGDRLENDGVLHRDAAGRWYVEWTGWEIRWYSQDWSKTITVQYVGEIPPEGIASIETNIPGLSGLYVEPTGGKETADVPFDKPAVSLPEQPKALTIVKQLKNEAEGPQSFLFCVTRPDGSSFYEVIHIEAGGTRGEKTIAGLPSGSYQVREMTDWSWNYELDSVSDNDGQETKPASGGERVTIAADEASHTVTFTNKRLVRVWLAARDYVTNQLHQK